MVFSHNFVTHCSDNFPCVPFYPKKVITHANNFCSIISYLNSRFLDEGKFYEKTQTASWKREKYLKCPITRKGTSSEFKVMKRAKKMFRDSREPIALLPLSGKKKKERKKFSDIKKGIILLGVRLWVMSEDFVMDYRRQERGISDNWRVLQKLRWMLLRQMADTMEISFEGVLVKSGRVLYVRGGVEKERVEGDGSK